MWNFYYGCNLLFVQPELVDPFAQILLSSYRAAADDARAFTDEWGYPPTTMDKAHRFRSIVQAQVSVSDRYRLHPDFMEAGRVQVTDREIRFSYLIRSRSAVEIDAFFAAPEQLVLFQAERRRKAGLPVLLAYEFDRVGMRLWSSSTEQKGESKRLVPAGEFDFVGLWRFDSATPPDGQPFDQGSADPWEDLGNPDIGGEAQGQ